MTNVYELRAEPTRLDPEDIKSVRQELLAAYGRLHSHGMKRRTQLDAALANGYLSPSDWEEQNEVITDSEGAAWEEILVRARATYGDEIFDAAYADLEEILEALLGDEEEAPFPFVIAGHA